MRERVFKNKKNIRFTRMEVNFRMLEIGVKHTNLNSDTVKPVAIYTQIKRVDSNKPIRRRDHA